MVILRFKMDPDTGEPHISRHGVSEAEVEQVLVRPIEERFGYEGVKVCLGQTEAGRYLRVIFVPDPEPGSGFIVTAYEPGQKVLRALRRRLKKKRRDR